MSESYEPSFSVCIPIYNHGRFISDTIQSVLDQTYQNFEIVIADNASTDDSVAQIEKFNDPRIKLYRNRYNIGFAPNLQRVTSYATNDYLNLLSSDDQMKPNTLETYAKAITSLKERPEYLILYSDAELFDNDNRVCGYQVKEAGIFDLMTTSGTTPPALSARDNQIYKGRDVLADALSRLRTFTPFLSLVYSRTLWQAVEGYNSVRTIGPDKHFAFKLLSKDPTVVYIPEVLYRYRSYVSDNRAVQYTTLKQLMDDYLYTLEYTEAELHGLGLSQQQLIRTFIDQLCLKRALRQLGYGNYTNALRFFAFALAAYPAITLRMHKTYMLLPLLLLGPIGKLLGPALLSSYKKLERVSKAET
ncbi:MAG: glycosyltransferase family 2 protein [Chloroflexota bacterium]